MTKLTSFEDLETLRSDLAQKYNKTRRSVRICMTGCRALGALDVYDAFVSELEKQGLTGDVNLVKTGCIGFCAGAPVIAIDPDGIFYQTVSPDDVPEIVSTTLRDGKIVERLCWSDNGTPVPLAEGIPFFKNQKKLVLKNCGLIDPTSIEDYIVHGGYGALARSLNEMTPESVIQEVLDSGLRGRGGAGFPTGRKWTFARGASGEPKYLVCNADEGDPGAFMDRAVLEGDPHAVIEGMLIAAYAIGAAEGFMYVRAEYPIAIEHVSIALDEARELDLLGDNILGSGFSFNIAVRKGAGAFVCGEETALIASIEGRRGMPRPRPPFPAISGLWGKPTNINNVETLANVPHIILEGSKAYASIGTEKSKGTKIFALAGKVNNTGLVEVPMGATIRDIVFEVGGGIPDGRTFKAVQMGGPSGGCVPDEYLDLSIDYDSVAQVGAIMGSGGLIVMDDATCMVDVARFFIDFVQKESCGKCVPCRVGTKRMLDILTRITKGEGVEGDIEKLERLANVVKPASLCGLGQTAPNPVLTTIRYFRDEYEAHIRDKKCPAGVCQALLSYSIDPEKCTGCHACAKVCPTEAATGEKKEPHTINRELCIKCGACLEACKFEAIVVE